LEDTPHSNDEIPDQLATLQTAIETVSPQSESTVKRRLETLEKIANAEQLIALLQTTELTEAEKEIVRHNISVLAQRLKDTRTEQHQSFLQGKRIQSQFTLKLPVINTKNYWKQAKLKPANPYWK